MLMVSEAMANVNAEEALQCKRGGKGVALLFSTVLHTHTHTHRQVVFPGQRNVITSQLKNAFNFRCYHLSVVNDFSILKRNT